MSFNYTQNFKCRVYKKVKKDLFKLKLNHHLLTVDKLDMT